MNSNRALPPIIQGGMGIGVSGWRLARAVAQRGQLGVVSGTALDTVLVRRLQEGDPGGHLRRAMSQFPIPGVVAEVSRRYFREEGLPPETPYKLLPMYREGVSRFREQVTMLANFVEVWLAREGHDGPVGINLLTKIQFPTLASLYGAMLAGVDCVLMGAGIPREIPAVLDAFAEHRPAAIRFEVEGLPSGETRQIGLDPGEHWSPTTATIPRPAFLPIIASNSLATVLARKASGRVDGFIIEGPTAGGHNAPPRGETRFNERGEPIYGERDVVDLPKMTELGLPFWLAGGTGQPGRLREAQRQGAAGIQVGTLFAYCEESDLREDLKQSVLEHVARGEVEVFTDPQASPTGYPFKVVHWADDPGATMPRDRICDLGYLRVAYFTPEGTVDYRCASEPVDAYVRKGGKVEETEGRRCLCNALLANIGHAQLREGGRVEPPLLTSGDDLQSLAGFLAGRSRYSAADVIDYLLADTSTGAHPPT
jgi:nitronate monooxygenase